LSNAKLLIVLIASKHPYNGPYCPEYYALLSLLAVGITTTVFTINLCVLLPDAIHKLLTLYSAVVSDSYIKNCSMPSRSNLHFKFVTFGHSGA